MRVGFLLGLFCLFGVFTFATETHEAASFQERTIGRLPIERNEPLAIRSVKAKGNKVRRNKKFNGGDDWLQGLSLEIKNKSKKVILFASIQLQFPRPSTSSAPFAVESIEYGNSQVLTRPITAADRITMIAVGQTVEVKLEDERFRALKQGLPEIGYFHGAERVVLRIDAVVFEDGTMWRAGSTFRRDASSPGAWFNSELAEFMEPIDACVQR